MSDQETIEGVGCQHAWATFSGDSVYRYTLGRMIADEGPRILWVMLNPSTATEAVLDPTIRRCIGFSRAWGFGTMVVVNLFALRSTDPRALARHASPVGPDNDAAIAKQAALADRIVVAWGAYPLARDRGRAVVLRAIARSVWCLGVTNDGSPRHPLYIAAAQPCEPYPHYLLEDR